MTLTPNGVKVLRSFGFSFERARARQLLVWESVDGITLERLSTLDVEHAEDQYGAPMYAVHRVDLHKELLRLVLQEEEDKHGGYVIWGVYILDSSGTLSWSSISRAQTEVST